MLQLSSKDNIIRFIYEDLLHYGMTLESTLEQLPEEYDTFIGKKWRRFVKKYGIFLADSNA